MLRVDSDSLKIDYISEEYEATVIAHRAWNMCRFAHHQTGEIRDGSYDERTWPDER